MPDEPNQCEGMYSYRKPLVKKCDKEHFKEMGEKGPEV